MDWSNPTQEQLAAIRLAKLTTDRSGLTEVELAEFIITAAESLWYLQASTWADTPPEGIAEDSLAYFQEGCKLVTQIVDLGYDEQRHIWWPLFQLWPDEQAQAMGVLRLMDLGVMMERLPDVGIKMEHGEKGFNVVSRGFVVLVGVVCGVRWRQRYNALLRAQKAKEHLGAYSQREGRSTRRRI